jgi:hypothetical protein
MRILISITLGSNQVVHHDWLARYDNHHPDHLSDAVEKMAAKSRRRSTATASPQKRNEQTGTNVIKML